MFNGVVNPFIGTSASSQQHLFDHVLLSSFPPPHDHQFLHVMANRSSFCFDDYDDDPYDQNTYTGRSLFVQSSSSCKKEGFSSNAAGKPSLDSNDGLIIIDNSSSSALQRESNDYNIHDPWCSDEVAAPLKVRSRKIAGLEYKRSEDKKYEEEEEQFNQTYPSDHLEPGISRKAVQVIKQNEQLLQQHKNINGIMEETPTMDAEAKREVSEEEVVKESSNNKRKRRRREEGTFEALKRCCEDVVNKMMAHQEELHKKLIEDIIRRDEERLAREEAWKNQEMMAKVREEAEMMAREKARAERRQAMIIEFLKKLTSSCHDDDDDDYDDNGDKECPRTDESHDKVVVEENPNSLLLPTHPNNHIVCTKTTSEDSRTSSLEKSSESEATNQEKGSVDIGKKRWPRDEVLALINLRCKMSNNTSDSIVGGKKGHLWERISRGMSEMGYERSAKRCKEKWENINKYFRRTKGNNKKRSMDSRTCPYFHQLSCLYSEGTVLLVSPTEH